MALTVESLSSFEAWGWLELPHGMNDSFYPEWGNLCCIIPRTGRWWVLCIIILIKDNDENAGNNDKIVVDKEIWSHAWFLDLIIVRLSWQRAWYSEISWDLEDVRRLKFYTCFSHFSFLWYLECQIISLGVSFLNHKMGIGMGINYKLIRW